MMMTMAPVCKIGDSVTERLNNCRLEILTDKILRKSGFNIKTEGTDEN